MSKIALSGNASGTGTFTLASPNSNSDRTLTLPDNSGTVLTTATPGVPVNGPAFSAYMNATQSLSLATLTKVAFDTERFDTNSCFDTSTYRFTPTVAGYYQVNAMAYFDYSGSQYSVTEFHLYKNGGSNTRAQWNNVSFYGSMAIADLVYMNGTTDYIEMYALISGGSGPQLLGGGSFINRSVFAAALVRAA
jgi:hypothetical protein